MKWFHVNFTDSDLHLQNDQKFVHEFVHLLHNLKQPEKLGLYGLKFHIEEGQVFYVSAPLNLAYKVKEFLSPLNVQEVSRPNLNVIKLELGKNGILD